ncbi:MAG TPA: hypothetical protein VEU54_08150 [Steroidobacteraceae bacterium]|jgi:uncharacterized lipoprotein|nr:hypothetical protein [Steroidobacteraceae bacterium]
MMKSAVSRVALALMLVAVAGCHPFRHFAYACHKHQPYMSASSIAPLRTPPGLDAPDTSAALKIPTLNEPAPPPRTGRQPCLDEPPSFKVPKAPPPPQA